MPNSTPKSRTVATELARELKEVMSAANQKNPLIIDGTPQWTLTENDKVVVSKNRNNKTTVVKLFNYDSYAGPSANDFIARGQSIYQAAQHLLSQVKPPPSTTFEAMWVKLQSDIKKYCVLNPDIMAKGDETSKTHFEEKYENAVQLLATFRTDLTTLLKGIPKYSNENFEGEEGLLRKTEIGLIRENGRPNIVNVINIDQQTHLISAQYTLGETTIPSSITTGGPRNFVKSVVGVVEGGTTEIHDIDYRLGGGGSSIGIKDDIQRHEQNDKNIEELLQAIATDKIVENSSKGLSPEYPLELRIFSLTLLTPFKKTLERSIDAIKKPLSPFKKIADIPSEQVMMKDVEKILAEYNDKKPFKLEIKTNDGSTRIIWVKPQFSHINIPTNITQIGPIDPHSIAVNKKQTEINNKGFSEYFREMEDFIAKNQSKFSNEQGKISITANVFNHTKRDYENKTVSLAGIFSEFKSYADLVNSRAKIETRGLKGIEKYRKIMAIRAEIYNKNPNRFNDLNNSIQIILSDHTLRTTLFNTDEGRSLRKQLLAMQCYANNQRLYFNDDVDGNYKIKENAFVLLANMHLSLFTANISHTSGCKSAKDRTGMLNIYKEAMTIFSAQYGFYPDPLDNSQATKLHLIIKRIHYKVASMESAALNDPGAHGVQSTLPVDPNTKEAPFSPSKPMGLLAKAPFKNVKAKRKLISSDDTAVYEITKTQISQLVKNLVSPADGEKLKKLINFDDTLLAHAIEVLNTELKEVLIQTAAQSKTVDTIEIEKHSVKKKLLQQLIVIADLKNRPYDTLKKRLEEEVTFTHSDRSPYPYAISYLITKLSDPSEQQSIRSLLEQLSIKHFRQYDSCKETLLLQQAMTSGKLDNLLENRTDYEIQLKQCTDTRDQEILMDKIRHESSLVSNVLSSIALAKNKDSMKGAENYLRYYLEGLKTIIRNNTNPNNEKTSAKETTLPAAEASVITGRGRSISPTPKMQQMQAVLDPRAISSAAPSSPRSAQKLTTESDTQTVTSTWSPTHQRKWPPDSPRAIVAPIKPSQAVHNPVPPAPIAAGSLPAPPVVSKAMDDQLKEITKHKLPPPPDPNVQLRINQIVSRPAAPAKSTDIINSPRHKSK